ncbi:MAG: GNAT family N-acetyltransferase [Lachnospiraceae bacterium]|nr:GNAT family N-acetyltransferase [Lachnospiraceae bacterium]
MNIRPAQPGDLEGINSLLLQVLQVHAELRPDIFIPGTKKYTDEELMGIMQNPLTPIFVAENEAHAVLGYAFCIFKETKGVINMHDRKDLYIDDLCVDEASRGSHVASSLCRHVTAFAREQGCRSVTLNVWKGNTHAENFYDYMGFQPLKTTMEIRL